MVNRSRTNRRTSPGMSISHLPGTSKAKVWALLGTTKSCADGKSHRKKNSLFTSMVLILENHILYIYICICIHIPWKSKPIKIRKPAQELAMFLNTAGWTWASVSWSCCPMAFFHKPFSLGHLERGPTTPTLRAMKSLTTQKNGDDPPSNFWHLNEFASWWFQPNWKILK